MPDITGSYRHALVRSLLIAVAAALCLVGLALAQQGAARAALEAWIAQLNAGDAAASERYAAEAFADSFLQQVPVPQLLAVQQQLAAAGSFALDRLESESDTGLVALLRTSSGAWFRARLSVEGEPPRINGLLVQPAAAPVDAGGGWTTLDDLASDLVEQYDLPGVAVAYVRPGEIPRVGVAGVRQAGQADRVLPGDAFHIGSITKSVTATVIGALAQEGLLRWDGTLGELLPGIDMRPEFAAMPLPRLLRHQARIPQHLTFDEPEMSRLNGLPGSPAEQRAAYAAEVLAQDPLEAVFHYSNAGYAIAGHIAEVAAGEAWESLVQTRVFGPLGLTSCGVGWPATAERPDQPRGHYGARGARVPQRLDQYELGAFMAPAGDIHCSVADLARYGLAHLAGLEGEDGVLRAETVHELHRVRNDEAPYAAGWGVDPASGQHRHNGSAGTFFSYLVIDPAAGVVVAFLTNAGPPDGQLAAVQAVDAVLQQVSEADPES